MTTVNTSKKSYLVIDTHCHVQMAKYDDDRDAVIRRALDAGVGMVCVGVDLESSRAAVALAERYDGLWCSVGLHPNDNLGEMYDNSAYKDLATNRKVVAIGEIGLDYFRTTDPRLKEVQRNRFLKQLELAAETGLPVILHCRDAHDDMRAILKKHAAIPGNGLRGVVHSFNGSAEDMRAYISYGMYIGMNAIVTFSTDYEGIIREVPLDRLLLETDAPYLAPAPHRGQRNEPVYILKTAELIARLKRVPAEELAARTTENAGHLLYAGVDRNSIKA